MATCKDCIHEKLCVIKAFPDAFENTEWSKKPCDHFKPTADVAPKSEVDKWYHEYHVIKDELKQEKMYHRETEKLADKYCAELQTAKTELARKIFAEIDSLFERFYNDPSYSSGELGYDVAELKKKYTEENK